MAKTVVNAGAHPWILCLLVLLVCGGASADSGDEQGTAVAVRWLSEMRQAMSTLNYRGEIAYLKGSGVDSFQLVHSSQAGVEQERLISMNTPIREVIRTNEKVVCYFPESKTASVEHKPGSQSTLVEVPEDPSSLLAHYRLGLQGREHVARRLAQVVSIEPRDDLRYARLVWIDTETKLPLRFELLGDDGQVVEQMVFTALNVESSIPSADLEPSVKSEGFVWNTREKQALPLESLEWTLHDVPAGFQMVSYSRMKRQSDGHSVDHIVLSDGISSVSVYIEELKGDTKEHPRKFGAINARTSEIDGHKVIVMGEVPVKTVQAIGNGLKHQRSSKHG